MSLRVIGGELGGRRLASPRGRSTRPTRSAVREAWFSALGPGLSGARVLDLYAGTGALGIEALSRGAASVLFVESDPAAFRLLRRNVEELGLADRSELRRGDVFRELVGLERGAYDVALADPPYGSHAARLVEIWLEEPFAGILCVEHARTEPDLPDPDWHREYGDTGLSFYIATEES